jgi:hypothetical protein
MPINSDECPGTWSALNRYLRDTAPALFGRAPTGCLQVRCAQLDDRLDDLFRD